MARKKGCRVPRPKECVYREYRAIRFVGMMEECKNNMATAAKALDALGLRRMVVGHTPQITAGINACCGGRVYRIDTGLSSFYGGMKQCLEVVSNARPRVISSTPEYFW